MCKIRLSLLAAASFLFAANATPATAKPNAKNTPINNQVTSVDRRFMTKAAEGNIAEVMMGQLALKRSNNKQVQDVANMLIKEHSQAQKDLKQVAAKNGMKLPSQPNAMQKATYNRLARLRGAAFDKAFLTANIKAHLDTITLFQMENGQGRDAEGVVYAREYLPAIQNHTSMIVNTAQSIGVRIPVAARPYAKKQTSNSMGSHAH